MMILRIRRPNRQDYTYENIFDLQLFAGAGGAGGAGSGAGAAGNAGTADGAAAPGQQTKQQAEGPVAGANAETANTGESFDELIRGRYKADYDARVQATIQDRLKTSKEREAKAAPIMRALAEQYGIDANDIDGLSEAFLNDPKRYEEEALEQGVSPETAARLARLKRMEAERAEKQKAEAAQAAEAQKQAQMQQHFSSLQQQAAELKQLYPGFDLDTELRNPQFLKLTAPGMGIDVRTAYEAVHRDELRGAEMQYATQRTANRISAAVQAGQRRPNENGVTRGSVAVNSTNDPSRMTKEYRQQLIERARRGERITFDKI